MSITAVLLAGSRPGGDPLARARGTDIKAMIPVAGKPMVRWPADALLASEAIGALRIVAQKPERIASALPADPRILFEPSAETIAETLISLCDDPSLRWPLLVTTADHALLQPAMIADFLSGAAGADIAIGMVERRRLMARLPETRRTWIKLRGGAWSGANLFYLASPQVRPAIRLWRSVEQDRKNAWRMLSVVGPLNAVLAMLRLRTLPQLLDGVSRRFGLKIRAVALADPLTAVDVDKEEDLVLVEGILEGRA